MTEQGNIKAKQAYRNLTAISRLYDDSNMLLILYNNSNVLAARRREFELPDAPVNEET